MGIDMSSSLVFGTSIENVLKRETKKEKIKKFDENTGKPYFKEKITEFFVIGKKTYKSFNEFREEFGDNLHHYDYDSSDFINGIFGEIIKQTGSHRHNETIISFDEKDIEEAKNKFGEICANIGLSKIPNCTKFHLISEVN